MIERKLPAPDEVLPLNPLAAGDMAERDDVTLRPLSV
jgi:hypothetical protein